MTRQLEQENEDKRRRGNDLLAQVLDDGLVKAVARNGGELYGLSIRVAPEDCLITLRADFPGGKMVAFVGAESLPAGFRKAAREAARDGLRWRQDKYSPIGG